VDSLSTSTASLGANGALSRRPAAADSEGESVVPFQVRISDDAVEDLRRRLSATRLPEAETTQGFAQGTPLQRMKELLEYWQNRYDWRVRERHLNRYPQFRTSIDGLGFHFLHVRSPHPHALPLILTHGWPGSVLEFLDIVEPLTNPTAYGGTAEDAFHLVIPSLPGFAFSDKPAATGWRLPRIAKAWDTLMTRLGYTRYAAQGGDWGAGVTTWLGAHRPPGLLAIHLNLPVLFGPPPLDGDPSPAERRALDQLSAFEADGGGYASIQRTRPQTIGYALADSPAGLAAWIYEKLATWTDSGGRPELLLGWDRVLDTVSLYWFTNTAASSARLYAESFVTDLRTLPLELPVGVSIFPREHYQAPRVWAERTYQDLLYFNDNIPHGGHFAACEQPEIFVSELRACFHELRRRD
jgi:pimeloyl-ACP methyl ester carboxylesterase